MQFLVYSPLNSGTIEHNLGLADYSYYFVMKQFLPLLREFGEVEILESPPSDEDVGRYLRSGDCVYLSFTPPDKLAPITRCPAIPVFAWEYSTIPDEEFNRPEDNWVKALARSGMAITHSHYALEVVKGQLGNKYPIESIPAPIWDACHPVRQSRQQNPPQGLDGLNLDCTIIDSNDYLISNTAIRPQPSAVGKGPGRLGRVWNGEPLEYDPGDVDPDLTLIGFNDVEPWGVWSRSGYPWIRFGCAIEGRIELTVKVRGYAQNIGKPLRLNIGDTSADVLLSADMRTHTCTMDIAHASNVLAFIGIHERAVGSADPRDIGIGLAGISIRRAEPDDDAQRRLEIDLSDADLICDGLHANEDSGRWSAASDIAIQLPQSIVGGTRVFIELFDLMHNHQRVITICLGGECRQLTLREGRKKYKLSFAGSSATDYISITGAGFGPSGNDADPRLLGLGIAKITLESTGRVSRARWHCRLPSFVGWLKKTPAQKPILYTSIFNPKDGRKNWEDIITAFVYAFREDAGATLLIKITYHELNELYEDIFTFLIQLYPFKCRLMFIHGFLSDEQYQQLLLHSHFVVNASRGEGQCLPLMEFMSSGVPAIAPANTAMAEYIDGTNAFIVESSPELTFWPHDPRQLFRTLWHQVNWESLFNAFRESADVYRNSPDVYQRMATAAVASQQRYCSMANARRIFERFLENRRASDEG